MFSNRFNTKNDPLLEAVQNAMQDGEIRRQAVAQVNEAFGVYNRNAVVREDLADYDTAIEDVYYFMKEDIDFEFILEGEDDDYAKKYAGDAKPTGVDREGGSSRRKRLTARAKIRQKMGPGKIKVSPEGISHTKRGKEMGDYDTTNYFDRKGNKVGRNTATIEVEREEYDARLEEGNDGNLANNYPPYDKVTRGDVIAGATGKDQMGGKKKKMDEEQIDEISHKLALKAMKKSDERGEEEYDRDMTDDRLSDPKTHWDRAKRLRGHMKRKFGNKTIKTGGTDNLSPKSYEHGGGERRRADKLKKGPRAGMISARHRDKLKDNIKYSLGKHKKPNLPEEVDYSAPDRAAVTRDNKPSTPAQTNAATSGPSTSDKAALTNKIKTMQEAAYSAKAARAGKDIGKPGKEFKRIAKSASKRYGSEERGKKVAGAILKKIRAKHMKEEQISEIVVQKSQIRPGETLGQAMNRLTGKTAIKGGANDPSSANFKGPATATAAGQLAKSGIANMSTGGGAMRTLPSNLDSFQKGISQEKDKTAADSAVRGIRNRNPETKEIDPTKFLYPGAASAAGRATSVSSEPATSSASSMPPASKPAAASAAAPSMSMSDPKAQKLKESVHIGANKYRIV